MNTRTAVSRAAATPARRALALLVLLTLSGSALAGCAARDDDDAGSSTPSAAATSSSAAPSPSASPTAPAAEASTSAAAAGPALCTADMLSGRVEDIPGGASAGGVSRALVLTNTSGGGACTMTGYPGVSYLDAAGQQVGAAAGRIDGVAVPVTLEPGQSATGELRETVAQKYGDCQVQDTASLLVYPPEDTTSLSVAYPSTGCLNEDIELLLVGALQAR